MPTQDSTRFLRIAAWIWIGFLLAMALMDFMLYTQMGFPLAQNPPLQQGLQGQPVPSIQPRLPRDPFRPVYLFYTANGLVAFAFLALAHWEEAQKEFGRFFYPLLVLAISAAPILINVFVTPRFPNGPLANAEGMALRQLPILFVALALVAWEYELPHVILFSVATTALELGLIYFSPMAYQSIAVFFFIAIVRMISFIAVGVFISLLVTRLRGQSESLREANANLTHYASTLEQLTVSRERNRLARELHDTLAHSLTAISVSLATAKAYFDIDQNKSRELLDKSLDATRIGVDETRRALKALRSSSLEDMGLGLAIQRMAESAAARSHLKLTVDLKNPMPSLSPDVEQTIYRVAQESIENVVKHSQAKSFSVHLENDGHVTTLTIEDDGRGFDPHGKEATGHFGLVGMRERAELAGGKLKVKSPVLSASKDEKGKGTKVLLTI